MAATPCPVAVPAPSFFNLRDGALALDEDDTADIDFTTAFRASLEATAPRKRQTAVRPRRRGPGVDFFIHEDGQAITDSEKDKNRAIPTINVSGGSILAQPAQRFRPRARFATEQRHAPNQAASTSQSPVLTAKSSKEGRQLDMPKEKPQPLAREDRSKKPARRRTVYIPPDDTTMPTIYMGIFSPIKRVISGQNTQSQDATPEMAGIAAQMARKKGTRKSLVAAPARRAPLQHSSRASLEANTIVDVAGRRTGKENLPPGHLEALEDEKKLAKNIKQFDLCETNSTSGLVTTSTLPKHLPRSSMAQVAHSDLSGSVVKSPARREAERATTASQAHIEKPKESNCLTGVVRSVQTKKLAELSWTPGREKKNIHSKANAGKAPAKLIIPTIPPVQLHQQYPLLSEDVSNPVMYEENWLAHQEMAITQLVNSLFASAQGSAAPTDPRLMRFELLEIYQNPSFSLLYKRLQASVLYGNLSISKDVLAKVSRLKDDLGMKQAFLSLWLDTYNMPALKAALEVVIGRECSSIPRSSGSGRFGDGLSAKCVKATVRKYIEKFLIRNEDAVPEVGITNHVAWCCQRTFMRGLLLINLLDQAKSAPNGHLSDCLFLSTSPAKSSFTVVQALATMLNPAVGDVLRQLGHLGYTVTHTQYPLEEFEYHIENLAVDLRDGVRLTRLAELLLYPSASSSLSQDTDCDATTMIDMPSGEVLSLVHGEREWPLSQHLKFPCLGRTTRMYNVQLALSALRNVRGVGVFVEDIQAEDIVDGFREKTVALLLGLGGKWGLGGLIDWNDVRQEIKRLRKTKCVMEEAEDCEAEEPDNGFEKYKGLLKAWSSAVAGAKGISVTNLTTSFSDGKAFAAIVDEYAPYLPNVHADVIEDDSLSKRLVRLGCSNQFANLFRSSSRSIAVGRFFDRDFTVATLAFLCSRLLSASRGTRAAIVIQRGWRHSQERRVQIQRRFAKRVAVECMTVVQTRERLVWAKETILQYWRRHSERKGRLPSERLGRDVRVEQEQDSSMEDLWLSL